MLADKPRPVVNLKKEKEKDTREISSKMIKGKQSKKLKN